MDGLEFTTENLQRVEQTLFANPRDEGAVRELAYFVRLLGEHVISHEDELRQIRNAAYMRR